MLTVFVCPQVALLFGPVLAEPTLKRRCFATLVPLVEVQGPAVLVGVPTFFATEINWNKMFLIYDSIVRYITKAVGCTVGPT